MIERQKQGLTVVDLRSNKDFYLSPNDLVYLPSEDEVENTTLLHFENVSRDKAKNIYKVVSFTGNRLYVIPSNVSAVILNKIEFTQLNKIELTKEKEFCLKLKIDRLGNISTMI